VERGNGAIVADPDVGGVRITTESFSGEGDRWGDVRKKRGEFAMEIVVFCGGVLRCLDILT
jgi:hypothetical protein